MTRQEFITKQAAYTRERTRFTWVFTVLYFALMVAAPLSAVLIPRLEPEARVRTIFPAAIFAVVLGTSVLFILFLWRTPRKHGLLCPACGAPLTGARGQIAVATGKCKNCGQGLFEG